MKKLLLAIGSALLTLLVTLGTALVSLFSQPDVSEFIHISQVAYATAIIGGVVAAANQLRAEFKKTPKE